MEQTEHYGLKKPGENDYADVAVLNENMDAVDAALHGMETGKADLDPVTHKVVDSQMPPMDYAPTEHGHTWGEITGTPDAFPPSAHAASHGTGGSDPITPGAIGAEAAGAAQAVRVELTPRVDELDSKVSTLWSAIFEDITTNPFTVGFGNLDGLTLTSGVWNAALNRLEC